VNPLRLTRFETLATPYDARKSSGRTHTWTRAVGTVPSVASTIARLREQPTGSTGVRRIATRRQTSFALAAWILLVVVGGALVQRLVDQGRAVAIGSPPLHAVLDPVLGSGLLWAVVVGAALASWGPRMAARLRWRSLLVASTIGSLSWTVAVAVGRGADRLVTPVRARSEYWRFVPSVRDLGSLLSGYTDHFAKAPVHVQGHPPGTVVVLWVLREAGLSSPWWAAFLFVGVGVGAVPAVLVATREVAGEAWARRAAPFVVLAPTVIWIATSADALYLGLGTGAATLLIVASGRRDRRGDLAAAVGGALLATCAYFSYGLVLIGLVPLAVVVHRRRFRVLGLAALGAAGVVIAWTAAGFWWVDGFLATRARYLAGVSSRRPMLVFLVANLSALAIATGPAVAAGLARLRDHSMWLLVGAGVTVVLVADLSGMSKGEVERIWLPFTPWLLLAGAALARGDRSPDAARVPGGAIGWLLGQVGLTILVESLVRTPW
jgi:methylthioxylose transferase